MIEIIFVLLDKNEDDLLDYDDYCLFSTALNRKKNNNALMEEYIQIDINCDGYIEYFIIFIIVLMNFVI